MVKTAQKSTLDMIFQIQQKKIKLLKINPSGKLIM